MQRTHFAHLAPSEQSGRRTQILHTAVGAGADHHLVDLHVAHLVNGPRIVRQMRKGDRRPQFTERSMVQVAAHIPRPHRQQYSAGSR